jgi:hypothetical protein
MEDREGIPPCFEKLTICLPWLLLSFLKNLTERERNTCPSHNRIVKPWKVHPESSLPTLLLNKEVCHTMPLPFTLKSILRQKKNYGNSNISPCKNILIFKKSSKRNQNPSRIYNTL